MNLALEKITGMKIQAAEGRSYRNYKCPECLAPVLFIDPPAQIKHFRHLAHTAKKDCPLYHVACGHDISSVFQRRAFRQRKPRLFVRLSGRGTRIKWELILLVPRIDGFRE